MLSRSSRVQLFNPVDSSLPSSSVHGILQARILAWIQYSDWIQPIYFCQEHYLTDF